MVEPPRNAKTQSMFSYVAVVHDAADRERAPRYGDRSASDVVIDNLMTVQETDRIGTRFRTNNHAYDLLFGSQIVDLTCQNQFRIIDSRNRIFRHDCG